MMHTGRYYERIINGRHLVEKDEKMPWILNGIGDTITTNGSRNRSYLKMRVNCSWRDPS